MDEPDIIAQMKYVAVYPDVDPKRHSVNLVVNIGRPFKDTRHDRMVCPIETEGPTLYTGPMYGLDSFSALWNAMHLVRGLLSAFIDQGGKLYHIEDEEFAEPYHIDDICNCR